MDARIVKVLTLALDRGTPEHEFECAAVHFVRLCRKSGLGAKDIIDYREPEYEDPPKYEEPAGAFPCGKYVGRTFADAVRADRDYCIWAFRNMSRLTDQQRAALREALIRQ